MFCDACSRVIRASRDPCCVIRVAVYLHPLPQGGLPAGERGAGRVLTAASASPARGDLLLILLRLRRRRRLRLRARRRKRLQL